ncbi:NADH dehydrogenase [ubiquinone] 1 beta subcomplex subunit 3 isoform X2 [Galendromus occidentalis]|nr:NADH dehydrogenase [ubiquinone] 1 beta subcomplex subunit 3 isoform X2 [Galendromus occidentalis]
MGHGHHEPEAIVPKDHTIYKPDGIRQLDTLKERLAKKGLKDPWMRNEVWRYQHQEASAAARMLEMAGGWRCIGIGAAIGAVGALLSKYTTEDHHHGEGHEDGHGKHH